MRIFADKEMTKQIKTIYFGKVKVGESKNVKVFLFNDSRAVLTNLVYEFPGLPKGEVLEEVDAPVTIQPKAVQSLTLRWKPSKSFKEALEVEIEIKGEEVYMATRVFRVEREVRK